LNVTPAATAALNRPERKIRKSSAGSGVRNSRATKPGGGQQAREECCAGDDVDAGLQPRDAVDQPEKGDGDEHQPG
jgi:hypothetical protein